LLGKWEDETRLDIESEEAGISPREDVIADV
jgi:hypothetical protein